jgi:hypothetical protein
MPAKVQTIPNQKVKFTCDKCLKNGFSEQATATYTLKADRKVDALADAEKLLTGKRLWHIDYNMETNTATYICPSCDALYHLDGIDTDFVVEIIEKLHGEAKLKIINWALSQKAKDLQ